MVEFGINTINEFHANWGDVKIVHGKPQHSQSQNYTLNKITLLGIGKSPYEAMFGCSARLGVVSIGLPMDEIDCLQSEEDIETILQDCEAQNDHLGSDSLDFEQCHTTQVEENGPGTDNNSELSMKQ